MSQPKELWEQVQEVARPLCNNCSQPMSWKNKESSGCKDCGIVTFYIGYSQHTNISSYRVTYGIDAFAPIDKAKEPA